MNTIYKTGILCAALLFSLVVQAQELKNNPRLQERLSQAKLVQIQQALQLSDAELKELSPVYERYEAELNELRFSGQGRGLLQTNPDSLSAAEADRLITRQLDNAVRISSIRKKYYPEFKTVLTPQQVLKLYQSEVQLRRRVMQEFRRRFGNR